MGLNSKHRSVPSLPVYSKRESFQGGTEKIMTRVHFLIKRIASDRIGQAHNKLSSHVAVRLVFFSHADIPVTSAIYVVIFDKFRHRRVQRVAKNKSAPLPPPPGTSLYRRSPIKVNQYRIPRPERRDSLNFS
jgi:hypothetical protein